MEAFLDYSMQQGSIGSNGVDLIAGVNALNDLSLTIAKEGSKAMVAAAVFIVVGIVGIVEAGSASAVIGGFITSLSSVAAKIKFAAGVLSFLTGFTLGKTAYQQLVTDITNYISLTKAVEKDFMMGISK